MPGSHSAILCFPWLLTMLLLILGVFLSLGSLPALTVCATFRRDSSICGKHNGNRP